MFLAVAPKWYRNGPRDAEGERGRGGGRRTCKRLLRKLCKGKDCTPAPSLQPATKKEKKNQPGKRRKRKLGGDCRADRGNQSDIYLHVPPVERWGKNPDPRNLSV